jgi:hypothetical protein
MDSKGKTFWKSGELKTTLEPDCKAKLVQRLEFKLPQAGDYHLELEMHYGEQTLVNEYRIRVA